MHISRHQTVGDNIVVLLLSLIVVMVAVIVKVVIVLVVVSDVIEIIAMHVFFHPVFNVKEWEYVESELWLDVVFSMEYYLDLPLVYVWFWEQPTWRLSFRCKYRQFSNIRRSQSPNINISRLILQLSLPNPLKPGVKLRMKM